MIRTAFRVVCWVAFVPASIILGVIAAHLYFLAIITRAVPPS